MRFDAGEHIFRQGDENRSVYVLQEGLLKAYYLSDEGKENIKSFIQPGELIGSLAAAYFKEDCSFSVVCLEPSDTVELDFDALYAATKEDLEMASAMVEHLLNFSMKKERREREFLTESAEERYRMIEEAAYYRAEKRNFAPGHATEDWAAAEADGWTVRISGQAPDAIAAQTALRAARRGRGRSPPLPRLRRAGKGRSRGHCRSL